MSAFVGNIVDIPDLRKMRQEFPPNQISKLPKPMAGKDVMDKIPKGSCSVCGGYHQTSKVMHLDYVGHAALTDRLLDVDPLWYWEPMALRDGLPMFDASGGLWIRLTVLGMTRIGYGHAAKSAYKDDGAREKEVIGDALRNAAMRFGAALDLWHKGDLHAHVVDEKPEASEDDRKASDAKASATDKRDAELVDLALVLIDFHKHGKDMDAVRLWYAPDTFSQDAEAANEERVKVWGMLKTESALRSAIKANKPESVAA